MRVWPALLVVAAAGCFGDGPDEPEDPLVGWCPQWIQGPGQQDLAGDLGNGSVSQHLPMAGEDGVGGAPPTHAGRTLDLYRLHVNVTLREGELRLTAVHGDQGRVAILRDTRLEPGDQVQPFARFLASGEALIEVALNPIDLDEVVAAPLRLDWSGVAGTDAEWTAAVTYHYRVCGGLV